MKMRITPPQAAALLFACACAPAASGETPFSAFDLSVQLEVPPEPILPVTLTAQADFVPAAADAIAPARETISLRLFPPDPIFRPDPIEPRPTEWALSFPPGCFVAQRSGQFRIQDPVGCGATLQRYSDDGTSIDLTDRVLFLEADIKPPSGNQAEWRFRTSLELEIVPPEPISPPDPIRGSTVLAIGDDAGVATHRTIGWQASDTSLIR